MPDPAAPPPSPAQLMEIIKTQTEVAKLGLDLGAVMALVAERAQQLTNAVGGIVELAEGDDMVYRAAAGVAESLLGLRLKRKGSLSGLCVETGETLRCDDSETDPRVDREACRRVGLRSMIVVPLTHDKEVVGALKVLAPSVSAFGEGELHLLKLMSDLIAAAMYHATKDEAGQLFHRATHDALTGLGNRALLYDRLRHALGQAKENNLKVGLLMLDMDGLKQINDQHGHRAGDAAIIEMATRMHAAVRHTDTVARLGGDEFAIVLTKVEDRAGAKLVPKRLTERFSPPFVFENNTFQLGASIGLAMFPADAEALDALIEKADQAMYEVKKARKAAGAAIR